MTRFFASLLGLLLAAPSALSASTRPLSDIVLDLDDAPFSTVQRIAAKQAVMQFKMDKGPLYKSTPPMENKDPNRLSDEVFFEGVFVPASSNTKLALFSDDGCDVWINGTRILNNFKKGQHLPTLSQSLQVLKFTFKPQQTYHIKIHYSNTIFTGEADIDGCTLFAFDAGGDMMEVKINTETNGADKKKIGTIVIADKDSKESVYRDKEEPARRREVKVELTAGKASIIIRRGADKAANKALVSNLRLFRTQKPAEKEKDLFEQEAEKKKSKDPVNEFSVVVDAKKSEIFFLQGGPLLSESVRDQFLAAKIDMAGATEDQISVTVLWLEISGLNKGSLSTDGTKGNDVYDGLEEVKKLQGHTKLGLQRVVEGGALKAQTFNGAIEIQGDVKPPNFDVFLSNNQNLPFQTLNFQNGVQFKKRASADFGFAFRRDVDSSTYQNGIDDKGTVVNEAGIDDSTRKFQDPDPAPFEKVEKDKKTKQLLIVDADGPTAFVTPDQYFRHRRANFTQNVVFYFQKNAPERCSERLLWALTTDIGFGAFATDDDFKAVTVFEEANKTTTANAVLVGKHLGSTKLTLPNPKITSALTVTEDKIIPRNKNRFVFVKGENLVGEYVLKKGATIVLPKFVQTDTKLTKEFGDVKTVILIFNTDAPAGKDYDLIFRNVTVPKGITVPGFEIK